MIIFNFTGLNRIYWIPSINRESDGEGLWFLTLRWLQVEIIAYSPTMGAEAIRRFNKSIRIPS